jgi:G patch domain-containing protein 1
MKMGWKPGQGIGPRLTARQLKLQERKIGRRAAHVGSYVPEMEDDEDPKDAVDAQGKKHTFAPRDTGLMSFDNKQDRAGLGYVRGAGLNMPVASGSKSNQTEDISTGFGLGGHDADEDDLDIYANGAEQLRSLGDGGNGRRTAYDEQEDGDMQEGVVLLGEGVVGRDRARSRAQAQDTRDRTRLEKPAGKGGDVWHDGRPVVPGFTVDLKVVSNDQW